MTHLHVGLVTHPRSRFGRSAFDQALQVIEQHAGDFGVTTTVTISDEDQFERPVRSWWTIARNRMAFARLTIRWDHYLGEATHGVRTRLPWPAYLAALIPTMRSFKSLATRNAEAQADLRIRNINAAHLMLWKNATDKGADFLLVLEDDAAMRDDTAVRRVLQHLKGLEDERSSSPLLVSVSRSISDEDLGVAALMPAARGSDEHFFCSTAAFTNTTCATVYSKSFMQHANSTWLDDVARCVDRCVPIDWILNALILEAEQGDSAARIVTHHMWEPAFIQRSMHDA